MVVLLDRVLFRLALLPVVTGHVSLFCAAIFMDLLHHTLRFQVLLKIAFLLWLQQPGHVGK